MTYEEAFASLIADGIELGAGDYIPMETLEICKEALEKQISRKPILVYGTDYNVRHYLCPICDEWISEGANYCYDCGQRILWEE